ncbi:MAG: iron ABC transporter permease [Spirochaetes bacterium]|nr:iron ABC transporter permease [Spirochaetota bacterium]MBU1079748.1 iron ABC transporter permease [Spirochaetota bacterium]
METLRNKRKFGTAELLLTFSVLVLVVIVAVPVLLIIGTAFFEEGRLNLAAIAKVLGDPDTYMALWNSVKIATGTTIVSTAIGVFFAWLVARTDLPFKRTMKALFLVPFMLPSFIGALAWKILLSPRAGYISKLLMGMFGLEKCPIDIMSIGGIIMVESMYLFPFVFLQVAGALERMDPTLEESARISGARLMTITRKITLPLVMPSILAGALLVALYSLAHFGVPAILGAEKGIYNIPTKIYERIHSSGGSMAGIKVGTILSTILVVTAAIILKLQDVVLKKGQFQIIAGKSMRPTVLKLRGLKVPMLVVCIVYLAVTVVMPTVTIMLVGGLKTYGLPLALKNLSLDNYVQLFRMKLTTDAIWNSLWLSVSAAFVTMLAGTMISYVIVKMKVPGKFLLQFLGVLPFSLPGTVIALGCILTWSGRFGVNLYNSAWIIFVAYIARYMAFSIKSNSAALEQVSDSLEEASRACGATHFQTLKNIVLPLVRPGMISAFFLIFLPALRELTTSVLLYGPKSRTLGVAIYALNEDGETVMAAALATIALLIIFIGETTIRKVLNRLQRQE